LADKGTNNTRDIIFCNCREGIISEEVLNIINGYVTSLPATVTRISDLCGVMALKRNDLSDLLTDNTEHLVIGCHSRTMHLLLDQITDTTGQKPVFSHIDLIDRSPSEAKERIKTFLDNSEEKTVINDLENDSGWPSWYPVIDYARCTACGQCADFCLFGVYEKTGNRVEVVKPQGCKNNCPACARICPSVAIIFPKYKNGGAISGTDNIDEQSEMRRQAEDIRTNVGNDLHLVLQERKKKRESLIKAEAMKQAIAEREKALRNKSGNLNN
jgi:NAD-dependent dihydropyrimidine dehydrogenase PreA subunit